jgi:hypothetical protein
MTYKEELFEKIADVAVHTLEYVEHRVELEVLKGADKISQGLAAAIAAVAGIAMATVGKAVLKNVFMNTIINNIQND